MRTPTRWSNRFAWFSTEARTVTDGSSTAVESDIADSRIDIPLSLDYTSLIGQIRKYMRCRDCNEPDNVYHSVGGQGRVSLRCRACQKRLNRHEADAYLRQLISQDKIPVDLTKFGITHWKPTKPVVEQSGRISAASTAAATVTVTAFATSRRRAPFF